jgi:hypothetical protein
MQFSYPLLAILLAEIPFLPLEFRHFLFSGLHESVTFRQSDLRMFHPASHRWLARPVRFNRESQEKFEKGSRKVHAIKLWRTQP